MAPMEPLIDLVLERYGHHPSVIGLGLDVEWYRSTTTPEGQAVTDAEARTWLAAIRRHNPAHRLFLKHWEQAKMPPTVRDGITFIDDSQIFPSLDAMVAEFRRWGEAFAPAPVGFQFGYPSGPAVVVALGRPAAPHRRGDPCRGAERRRVVLGRLQRAGGVPARPGGRRDAAADHRRQDLRARR